MEEAAVLWAPKEGCGGRGCGGSALRRGSSGGRGQQDKTLGGNRYGSGGAEGSLFIKAVSYGKRADPVRMALCTSNGDVFELNELRHILVNAVYFI